jgi:hypothetical protein
MQKFPSDRSIFGQRIQKRIIQRNKELAALKAASHTSNLDCKYTETSFISKHKHCSSSFLESIGTQDFYQVVVVRNESFLLW